MSKTTKNLVDAMRAASEKKTSAYDTRGTVTRIEDGVAWVHIPGGVDETPVKLTINAKAGDTVQVRVGGGGAFLVGNATAPPTDDARANEAFRYANSAAEASAAAQKSAATASEAAAQAVSDAATAQSAADTAQNSLKSVVSGATTVEKAVSVMQTALEAVVDYDPQNDTTKEYFWHDANGAHVLGTSGEYRNDIDSTGMKIVDTSNEESVAEFSGSGISFFDNEGDNRHKTFSINSTGVVVYTETIEESAEITAAGSPVTYVLSHKPTTAQGHNSFGFVCPSDGSAPMYFQNTGVPITFQWAYRGVSGGTIEYDGDITCVITPPSNLGADTVTALFYYQYETVAPSYDVGTRDSAAGKYSAVIGEGLQAIGDNSVAVGKYNDDPYGGMLFSVGNGSDDSNRSNALTVDWNGNVEAAGDIEDGSGNVLSDAVFPDASGNITASGDITDGTGNVLSAKADASGMFISRTATASGTIGANTNGRITGNLTTVSGYSPIAIMGVTSNAGASATITEFGLYNNRTQVSSVVRNVSSSQISVTHTYSVLYAKTSLIG